MSKLLLFSFFALLVAVNGDDVIRQAIAILDSRNSYNNENINGHIVFTEIENGLHVYGNLTGLPFGRYSLHVHSLGDISTCYTSGSYFNFENVNHGGTNFSVNPIFGDSVAVFEASGVEGSNGTAIVNYTDDLIALRGRRNILGRTLVLHQLDLYVQIDDSIPDGGILVPDVDVQPPDGDVVPDILDTMNPVLRVACGVIAIRYPSTPWLDGSAVTSSPSLLLFIVSMLITFSWFN